MAAAYAAGAANLPFGVLRGYAAPTSPRTRGSRTIDVPVHRRGARRGAGASGPTSGSSTPSRPTGRETSSSGGSPACRRRRCSRRSRSIVTVEEIVDELEPRPGRRSCCPAWVIDAVAVVPGGAHPSYAHGYYERDNEFYVAWDAISRDREHVHRLDAGARARTARRRRDGRRTRATPPTR